MKRSAVEQSFADGAHTTEKNPSYYTKVHRRKSLIHAWQIIRESGIKSKSDETRKEISAFNENADNKIEQIYRKLRKKNYRFKPSKGITIPKKNKQDRPIVKSRIEDKIVQRSILDVLQGDSNIREYISVATSFGGIEQRSVKDAVKIAYEAMQNGAKWYIASDIHDFFRKIPKEKALKIISQFMPDNEFNDLLEVAVRVELENLAQLGEKRDLFPTDEIGVAQGCCLSPLIGNILLHDFDIKMNKRSISCLRYIDDFIILGPTQRHVKAAFESAQEMLQELGFDVYDPFKDTEKATFGPTDKGFDFLGCEIFPGLIRPTKKKRTAFLDKVEEILQESSRLMSDPAKTYTKRKSVIETLTDVSNVVMGWGSQYSFCNDIDILKGLDRQINEMLVNYLLKYKKARDICRDDPLSARRLLGVHLLVDCKSNPIIQKTNVVSHNNQSKAL